MTAYDDIRDKHWLQTIAAPNAISPEPELSRMARSEAHSN